MDNKEYQQITEFDFQLITDFFKNLERQGPCDKKITIKALEFIGEIPENARIADIGCGTGGQTMTLAETIPGKITAIDLLPEFIESLDDNIKKSGYQDRISTIVGSMESLPFAENELDLIWAEGSIYHIGFERGLREWHQYLKDGAYIAVSEATWLTDERPEEIQKFWDGNYSGIDTVSNKIRQMEAAGYIPVAYFVFPEYTWWNYFCPIQERSESFLKERGYSEEAKEFVKFNDDEIALYDQYKEYYSYAFYIGKKIGKDDSSSNAVKGEFQIRPETKEDHAEIYQLIQTAFQTAQVKDGDEQDFAVGLRNSENYIPELSLVAGQDGVLTGHMMLTKTLVTKPDGTVFNALLLAPLSVLIEYRNCGVGSALIREGFRLAASMGFKAVFLCGDPAYYNRFGFKQTSIYGIQPKNHIPEQYVLVHELIPGILNDVSGIIDCC